MCEELRLFEYGQRLTKRQRAILGTDSKSVGRRLYELASTSGGQAIGVRTGKLAIGYRADLLVIDDGHPTIAGAKCDRLLDRFLFSNTGSPLSNRMVGGKWIEKEELESMLEASRVEFGKFRSTSEGET